MNKLLLKLLPVFLLLIVTINSFSQETRPPGNTGIGFFVKNGKIYDSAGYEFIPLGVNAATYWDAANAVCKRNNLSVNIPNCGANAVRIVTQIQGTAGWNADTAVQRELVNRAVIARMSPMLEMHNATCDANAWRAIVNYWKSPAMVRLCQDYEQYLMVNVANEHNFPTNEEWRDSCTAAVLELRAAGIKNLVVFDAGKNCGQNPEPTAQYALNVLNADPQKNVLFSIHMYAFWRTSDKTFTGWTPPFSVETHLPALKNAGIPIIVGEWGWNSVNENYTAQKLVEVCEQNNIGWYFWSFFDQPTLPSYCFLNNVCGDTSSSNRTPAGTFLIPYLLGHAKKATIFKGIPKYSLITGLNGLGSVSINPPGGLYDSAVAVTLTATPFTGWSFIGWSGATTSTSNPLSFPMNGNKFLTAKFSLPPGSSFIEAENWTTQSGGSNSSAFVGYTGTGFLDYGGNNSFGQWANINITQAGNYAISFRYANGGATNRSSVLTINGTARGTNNFIPTGAWTEWQYAIFNDVPLIAGNNTIRLTANSGSGGPNLDHIIITGDSQAPTVPSDLTASNITQLSFTLSWTASDDNIAVTGYDVYQDGILKGSVTGTSINIMNLVPNTMYVMTVVAKDAMGNKSGEALLNVTTIPYPSVLHPNPSTGKIRIPVTDYPAMVYVFNPSGQLVKKVMTIDGSLDLSRLTNGIYMVKTGAKVFKLIKE